MWLFLNRCETFQELFSLSSQARSIFPPEACQKNALSFVLRIRSTPCSFYSFPSAIRGQNKNATPFNHSKNQLGSKRTIKYNYIVHSEHFLFRKSRQTRCLKFIRSILTGNSWGGGSCFSKLPKTFRTEKTILHASWWSLPKIRILIFFDNL